MTDSLFNILFIPDSIEQVNFNEGEPGDWFIIHISYNGTLTGLEVGNNLLTDVEGCLSLSNTLEVIRLDCQGIQNGDPVFELKISPNPVTDVMNLKMRYNGQDVPTVRIFDASGRLCFSQEFAHHDNMTINMDNYMEGCYFIHVQSAAGRMTKSILVIK